MRTFLLLLFLFVSFSDSIADDEVYQGLANLTKVLDLIENNYVDDVDSQELTVSAIKGMLKALDPYTVYLPPDRFKELKIDTYGEFGGIGIELTVKEGELTVIAPIEDTPAHRAGIKSGDKIISIAGQSTKGISSYEAAMLLRGPKDSEVVITIKSVSDQNLRDVKLKREIIRVKSVKSKLVDNDIAYIKLLQFQKKTSKEFVKEFKYLQNKSGNNLEGLIIDLRNNPGGLLDQAVDIADAFLDDGLIVSIKGRSNLQTKDYFADSEVSISSINTVVIVNKGSASASEVLAGALRDTKVARILGVKTFGKGSVQTIVELDDGSGIKLTTARFYTPKGSLINNVGIVPDIIVESAKEGDVQLRRAIELIKHSS